MIKDNILEDLKFYEVRKYPLPENVFLKEQKLKRERIKRQNQNRKSRSKIPNNVK